jgi:Mn-dependent DtxR family transcriptional regulator
VPIDIEEFETSLSESTEPTATAVVRFLFENRDAAFTRSEISTAIDRDPNTVGTSLTRLKRRDLVRHRGSYWAITDDHERLLTESRFSDSLSRLATELGNPITSESEARAWSDAQPDQPHPSEETDSGSI